MTSQDAGVPLTLAEQSVFRRTGRTDEVEQLCAAYADERFGLYPIMRVDRRY